MRERKEKEKIKGRDAIALKDFGYYKLWKVKRWIERRQSDINLIADVRLK